MTVAPFALLILLPFLSLPPLFRCSHRKVIVPGDIILGGLFPIHAGSRNASDGSLCGRIKADQGVAMLFALEAINNSPRLLPGLRLGTQILDTCSVETHALEQSLEFIKSVRLGCAEEELDGARRKTLLSMDARTDHPKSDQIKHGRRQKITAIVGAASSQVSVMVASMLQLFKAQTFSCDFIELFLHQIPMLSYSSTGVELSEKPRFAYFSRVVPPDNLQAKAMAHLVAQLDWNYVHAIVDTGSYGERGMDSFRGAATELGICIEGEVHKISRRWTDDQFEELLIRMRNSKARGVVMFVDEDNLRRFLSNLKRLAEGRQPELRNNFWFVASDSWGMKGSVVKGFEHIVNGAITVAPKVRFLNGFDEYFASLSPSNTFLSEYWQSMNCSERFHHNFGSCFQSKGYKFMQEAYVPFVYDAVQLVARALHSYIQEECGLVGLWEECPLSSEGQPPLIGLNGDGTGQYNIFQIDSRGVYRRVGGWMDNGQKELDVAEIRLGLQRIDGNFSEFTPLSVCSLPCPRGQYRAYQDQNCCWTCIPCDTAIAIVPNQTSCVQCPLGEVPNPELTACHQIVPSHLDWDSPWALVPALFSSVGLLATSFVTLVFLRFNYTPVVMASGRELCYCMLAGIALCYSMTFVLVSRPSELICTLTRLLPGLSMSTVYAAILVKTNRLARVFKPNNALRPKWIGPTPQVFFCIGLASVQLAIASIWLWLEPPGTAIQYPTRIEAVLTCRVTFLTLPPFKTRKIPENFNETRLIGFTMYSTSLLWLSFGPIYFATQNNFKVPFSFCFAQITSPANDGCTATSLVANSEFSVGANCSPSVGAVHPALRRRSSAGALFSPTTPEGTTKCTALYPEGMGRRFLRRMETIATGAWADDSEVTAIVRPHNGTIMRETDQNAYDPPTTVIRKQSDRRKSSMTEKKTTNSAFGAADGGREAERRRRRRRKESLTEMEKEDGREGEERGSVMSAIDGRKANGTVPRAQSPPAEMNNPVQLILREISGESATFL
uniref:G_PROTEIN_RECEP_F3_4 domain-containing protein n=1 Tax=Globodera pallida TaxID=36090 RepID=A0A183BM07_GLOPA